MVKIICKILGHMPIKIDKKSFTAICSRCGKHLKVSYDMSYGETVVTD